MTKDEAVKRWIAAKEAVARIAVELQDAMNVRSMLSQQMDALEKQLIDAERSKNETLELLGKGKGSEAAFEKAVQEHKALSDKLEQQKSLLASNEETIRRLSASETQYKQCVALSEGEMFATLIPEIKEDIRKTLSPKLRLLYAVSERSGKGFGWPPDIYISRDLFGSKVPDHDELRLIYAEVKRLLKIEGYYFVHTPHGIGTEHDRTTTPTS